MEDVRLLSLDQWDAYSTASAIYVLEERLSLIDIMRRAPIPKAASSAISQMQLKLSMLRSGTVSEEDMVEAQFDIQFGRKVRIETDRDLEALGIAVVKKKE